MHAETERMQYKTSKGAEKDEVLYKVWQKFTWIDIETGDKDENEFFSSGMNEFEKGLGSALTYAERYFLLKYFQKIYFFATVYKVYKVLVLDTSSMSPGLVKHRRGLAFVGEDFPGPHL